MGLRTESRVVETGTVLNESFRRVGEVKLDERKRVPLTKTLEELKKILGAHEAFLSFAVFVNEAGQILLSPEVTVPLREAWLYRNPEALRLVARGLEEAREGKFISLGSFEKYAD